MSADPHPIVTYSKNANFDDARDDLRLAIEGKGLVIDYQSFVNRPWRSDGSPASKAALKEVERLLDGIAREALGLR